MPPDRLILAFDTSAAHCAAVLLSGGRVLVARHEEMAKGQGERLMVLLEEMLSEAGVVWRDLDAIGVGTGPGNFTGIRISVAAARGLALGLGIPAIGVSALEALAWGAVRPVTAVIDAGRGQVYAQVFEGGMPELSDPDALGGPVVGAGFAAPTCPLAEAIARVARSRLGTAQPRPAPLYIREADAAPSRNQGPEIIG